LITRLYAIDPKKNYELTPDSISVKYESTTIMTNDGFSLYSWIYYPQNDLDNNNVIILAYPDKGNMS